VIFDSFFFSAKNFKIFIAAIFMQACKVLLHPKFLFDFDTFAE